MSQSEGVADLIEAELSEAQRAALEEDCMLLGVGREQWRAVPALRVKYESVAAAARALRIMAAEDRAWTDALLRSCVQLDLSYEAVRKRLGSWRRDRPSLPRDWEKTSGT